MRLSTLRYKGNRLWQRSGCDNAASWYSERELCEWRANFGRRIEEAYEEKAKDKKNERREKRKIK